MRWESNHHLITLFKSPEFKAIKDSLKKNLKEEYTWQKKNSKSPIDMNESPAKTRRLIMEQIRLLRMLDQQKIKEQQYLDDLIKQHEDQNYGK